MNSNSIVYTNLDSLYDTRLGTYWLMDPRFVKEYLGRIHKTDDQLLYLRDTVFEKIYSRRDKQTLVASSNTSVIELLRKITFDVFMKNKTQGFNFNVELHINAYPYILTDEEKKFMSEFYMKHILHLKSVELIYEDMEKMSQDKIYKIKIILIHNGVAWLMTILINNPHFKSPSTRLITNDKTHNELRLQTAEIEVNKIHDYLMAVLAPYISLEFIEDEMFKVILEDRYQ